jgi:CMP-N-acetylneuraminic acid synthetase|tara:strand:- start:1664 stop:2371 length:708 start_codon:yes stop_codon:yes gene_type:complete
VIAYIPARGGSKRIPNKNIKKLGGKPIIGHVIGNVRQLDFISEVYVSTDNKEIQEISESFGAKTFELRPDELSDDNSGFIDLIHKDIPRYVDAAGGDSEILFVMATAALVPPSLLQDAYSAYLKELPEVLMGCVGYPVSPFLAMVQKEDGYWNPMFPEKVLYNTQDLPKALVDSGLFYFFNQNTLKKYRSVKLVDRLYAYEVNHKYAVDVDTLQDWSVLEEKYEGLKNRRSCRNS